MNNPFKYPQERFESSKANNFFCELANEEIPTNILNACHEISGYSVVKVPVRKKGITSGKELACFWNANVISQTFGGKPINGWIVKYYPSSKHATLIGHSVWLTPEGKLVDVTKRNSGEKEDIKFRYFLPTDEPIKVWKDRETMKLLYVAENVEVLKVLTSLSTGKLAYGLKRDLYDRNLGKYPKYDEGSHCSFAYEETINWENYLNKVVDPQGFPVGSEDPTDDNFHKELKKRGYEDEVIKNARKPFIGVVGKNYPTKNKFTSGLNFYDRLFSACDMNQNFLELHSDIDHRHAWASKVHHSETVETFKDTVCGISTANGKSIFEIPPKFELVSQHEIPRKKSKKRKVEKLAFENNLTVQEFLMVNSEYFFPHPFLQKKSNYSIKFL